MMDRMIALFTVVGLSIASEASLPASHYRTETSRRGHDIDSELSDSDDDQYHDTFPREEDLDQLGYEPLEDVEQSEKLQAQLSANSRLLDTFDTDSKVRTDLTAEITSLKVQQSKSQEDVERMFAELKQYQLKHDSLEKAVVGLQRSHEEELESSRVYQISNDQMMDSMVTRMNEYFAYQQALLADFDVVAQQSSDLVIDMQLFRQEFSRTVTL